METFNLESREWLAELCPSLGGNLVRLFHKPLELEVLRSPKRLEDLRSEPERYGIPVLCPPNRIDGGRFLWDGRSYELPLNEAARGNHLHGVALGRPWTLELGEGGGEPSCRLSFVHDATKETFEGFPCHFSLSLEYRLKPGRVEQLASAVNLGDEPMPFGVGFHSSFALPGPDASLWISAGEGRWEIEDVRKLPTGRLVPWEPERSLHRPGGQPVANGALSVQCPMASSSLDGRPFRGAILESRSRGARIVYEAGPDYGQWCVWNDGGGKGFVCVEPLTCMANAFKMDLPSERSGAASLGAGKAWSSLCSIAVQGA